MDGDFFKNLFKGTAIPPRERSLFQGGEGLYYRCLDKYVQEVLKERSIEKRELRVYCSNMTKEEVEFFENILFDLLPNAKVSFDAELFLDLEEISKQISLSTQRISDILFGLSMLQIEVRDSPEEDGFVQISWVFPGCELKDKYFNLNINRDFQIVCAEVKKEIGMAQ